MICVKKPRFRSIKALFALLPLLFAFGMFLADPEKYARCVLDGISLWAVCVLPVTFPFLFLTAALSATRAFGKAARLCSRLTVPLFRVSGTGGCLFFLSVLSGYPVGARTLADCRARGLLSADETFRTACLASTTSPVFLVGTVGGAMLGSAALGWLLLLAHLCGVTAVCLLLRFLGRRPPQRPAVSLPAKQGSLYEYLSSSVLSVLCVGGAIALFSCFGEMACDLLRLSEGSAAEAVVRGLIEMTTGCKLLCADPTPARLALCAFFVTFGGGCVLCQQLSYLLRAGVKPLPFVAVKLVQGVFAALICYFIMLALLS